MSYTPDYEKLESPLTKLLEGIDEFNEVTNKRIKSGDYDTDHILELNEIRKSFSDLQIRLENLGD